MFIIYPFLISLCYGIITLNIDDILLLKENNGKNNNTDFSITLFLNKMLREIDILNNLFLKDFLVIQIDSENLEKIRFECDFFGPTSIMNSYINCNLKESFSSYLKGPFYFRKEHFEKSFYVTYKGENLYFTLKVLDHIFYSSMLKSIKRTLITNIFNYKTSYSNITIPIAFSLDNGFIYQVIVSITSILENAFKTTKYDFYIMHPSNFNEENKIKLKNFEKKYERCSINFIDMKDRFVNAKLKGRVTLPAYYRLALAELLPNINKIIYLDGDTLIFIDLKEMYDIDMDNYYYKGFLDYLRDTFIPKNTLYICSGVLLINLEELRKDDIVNITYKFMEENKNRLMKEKYHDQPIINAICYKKNGILPAKYGMFNFETFKILFKYTKHYRYKYKYSRKELVQALRNPRILHYNKKKPWKIRYKYKMELWWNYARKSGYYDEMCNRYKICRDKK